MRLLAIRGDERPVLAVMTLVLTGLATFFAAVFLLGGTGQANPGTETLWTTQLRLSNSRSSARRPPPALQANEDVLLSFGPGGLTAVDVDDGEVRWSRDLPVDDRIHFPGDAYFLALTTDAVVVPRDNEITLLELSTGETRWAETHDTYIERFAVGADAVYVLRRGPVGLGLLVTVRDLATGAVRWERELADGELGATDALAGEETLFASVQRAEVDPQSGEYRLQETEVVALDAATGEERWREELDGAHGLAGGRHGMPLVIEHPGGLLGLDPADGARVWDWSDAEGHPHGSVVAAGRVATVLGPGGDVIPGHDANQVPVVLDATTGREVWRGEPEYNFTFVPATDRLVMAASHGAATSFGPATQDAELVVRDLPSGDVTWQRTYRTETPWSPIGLAVVDDRVFASASNGAVHALTLADGDRIWSVDPDGSDPLDTGPVVAGDALVLLGEDGALRSFSMTDGQERWSTLHSVRGASPPAVDDRHVYAATGLGIVRAYDRTTGDEVWETPRRHPLNEHGAPRPAVADGTVVVADPEGELVALDAADGSERWTRPARGVIGTAGHGTDVVVAIDDGQLTAVDAGTGTDRWATDLGAPLRWGPVSAGQVVLVATAEGEVVALGAAGGEVVWRHTTDESQLPLPSLDASAAYLRIADGVVALALSDGSTVWEAAPSDTGSFVGGVAIGGGQVFVATADLGVLALSATSGEEIDRVDVAAPIRWLRAGPGGLVVVMTADGELRAYR
ncbi:MAG: PQQ-binding-like beta-propeller repeat protein [Nitriliruptorales bacterium]|nr:PQQ-binding-like beta-propeller repeat protein [Nitriliruptorales bacterium]